MNNRDPTRVMEHGFVEIEQLLPAKVCERLAETSMEIKKGSKAHEISNAVELDCKHLDAWADIKREIEGSATIRAAILVTHGVDKLVLDEAKLLEASVSAPPQIPHADDYNNSGGCFGVVQLRRNQQPTLAYPYSGTTYYVDAEAACDECDRWIRLLDEQARRREHLRKGRSWTCAMAGCGECGQRPKRQRQLVGVSKGEMICNSFRELLDKPSELIDQMKPCGKAEPAVGDALLALPTLIHRGPGGGGGEVPRRVLFFFVRPIFSEEDGFEKDDIDSFKYDPSSQVHAALLLHLATMCAPKGFLRGIDPARVKKQYKEKGYELDWFERPRGLLADQTRRV